MSANQSRLTELDGAELLSRHRPLTVSETLTPFVQEEYIIYQLDRQGFADTGAERVDHSCGHEPAVRGGLGSADETAAVAQQGEEHHGPAAELAVHRDQQERAWTLKSAPRRYMQLSRRRWKGTAKIQAAMLTETKHEVGIADQP